MNKRMILEDKFIPEQSTIFLSFYGNLVAMFPVIIPPWFHQNSKPDWDIDLRKFNFVLPQYKKLLFSTFFQKLFEEKLIFCFFKNVWPIQVNFIKSDK